MECSCVFDSEGRVLQKDLLCFEVHIESMMIVVITKADNDDDNNLCDAYVKKARFLPRKEQWVKSNEVVFVKKPIFTVGEMVIVDKIYKREQTGLCRNVLSSKVSFKEFELEELKEAMEFAQETKRLEEGK